MTDRKRRLSDQSERASKRSKTETSYWWPMFPWLNWPSLGRTGKSEAGPSNPTPPTSQLTIQNPSTVPSPPSPRASSSKRTSSPRNGSTRPQPSPPRRVTSPQRPRQPSRPNVHHSPPARKYDWQRDTSPTSSIDSDRRSSNLVIRDSKAQKRKLQKWIINTVDGAFPPNDPESRKANQRVMGLLRGGGLVYRAPTERLYYAGLGEGLDSKRHLSQILNAQTLEEKIQPPRDYSPTKHRRIADDSKRSKRIQDANVEELIRKLKVDDEAVQRRLAPKGLTHEQKKIVQRSFADRDFYSICLREEVKATDLARLRDTEWLNDSIINFYGAMVQEREDKASQRKIHIFNSFFYQKLSTQGYSSLRRWTKKIDIFEKDLVLFPVNISNTHWTAAAINFSRKRIEYYDSMGDGGNRRSALYRHVREYLKAEHEDKKKTPYDLTGWEDAWNPSSPQQNNGFDCGIFTCQTLEAVARGSDLIEGKWDFGAKIMPYIRQKMVLEIKQAKLEPR